jgi:hypothetical protein
MLSMRYIILSLCSAFTKNTKWQMSAPIINKIFFFRVSALCKKTHPWLGHARAPLKGPKREIFGLGIFAQIRPIWNLGTRAKNPKKLGLGPKISLYFPRFLLTAQKFFFFELGWKKVNLDCFYNHLFTIKRFFWFFIFYSVLKWFICGLKLKNFKRTRRQR